MSIWEHLNSWLHRKEAEKFLTTDDGDTAVRTLMSNQAGDITVQNPLPTDGDSVYEKDLDLSESNNYNFSGTVADYFNSLTSLNNDATANNPKQIKLWFKRTVYASAIGFGCNDLSGDFSNIKIELLGSGGAVRETIDLSSDNTKLTSKLVQFTPSAFNGVNLYFYTTDEVCLSNITIRKEVKVVAQIEALQDDGTVIELTATDSGNLKVANVEDGLSIAKGSVVGTSFIHKFGNAEEIDTADGYVDIWDGNHPGLPSRILTKTYSTTDDIDTVSSSSTLDTVQIEIQGLDGDYNQVTQTATLNGQNKVTLTTPLIRVFRMKNIGATDLNDHIYCYVDTPIVAGVPTDTTKVRAIIDNGNNQTLMSSYTVPAGKTAYIRQFYVGLSSNKASTTSQFKMFIRPFGQVFQLKFIGAIEASGSSFIEKNYIEPEVVLEKSDIKMQANTTVNGSGVASGFDIVLVDN
jgi:hypothetical protein